MDEEPADDMYVPDDESCITDNLPSTGEETNHAGGQVIVSPIHGLATTGRSRRFVSESLDNHHRNCVRHGYYNATVRLVSRAAFQDKYRLGIDTPATWVIAFLTIARIVFITTEEVHVLLSSLLTFLNSILYCVLAPLNIYPDMPLPLSTGDFQSMITNASNTNSLKSILPIPHFEYVSETEHTFCSPTELVPMTMFMPPDRALKQGVCDRYRSTVKSMSYFEKRNKIAAHFLSADNEIPSILVYITLWSDGWDPNRSNKSNRSPVWTATGTMIFVELGRHDERRGLTYDDPYMANTVLMGVGPGKESHEEFFEMLVNEKQDKWEDGDGRLVPFFFYSRHHKKHVNVFITTALAIQDNPERRGCAELLGGNSNTHGIFGVSCDFSKLKVPFAACGRCNTYHLEYIKRGDFLEDCTPTQCTECLSWSIDKLCSIGIYETRLCHKGLVLAADEFGYDLTIKPSRITFDDCIKAWKFAIKKFIDERLWTASNVKAYLKLFCCNDDLQKRFVHEARQYINILDSMDINAQDKFEPEDLQRFRRMHNTPAHHLPRHPYIWLLFSILDITETPMHLTMGVMKALLRSMLMYTGCRDRQQDFIRRCNEIMLTVQALHVDLAPIIKFKDDKFGGFVAENYSAMAMIVPWLSHILEEEMMQPSERCAVPNPNVKPVDKWTGKECTAWLAERGYKGYSKLNAADAKTAVQQYFSGPAEEVPAQVQNPGRDMAHDVVRTLLLFANSLFSTIMLSDLTGYEARNRAQALVALFLSQYETIDEKLMPNRSDPVWIAKYNILGLLRVPEHFIRHRHFRNQYEGGEIGEGVVKELRKLCPNAVRDGWSRNMIKNFYRCQSLDSLFREAKNGTKMMGGRWLQFRQSEKRDVTLPEKECRKFRRYKELEEITSSFEAGHPVSVLAYRDCVGNGLRFFCVMANHLGWMLYFVNIVRGGDHYADANGYIYYPVALCPTGIKLKRKGSLDLDGYRFDSFAMMLPKLWHHQRQDRQYKYAMVSEDWRKLNRNGDWTSLF